MADRDRFELDLADWLRNYAQDAPTRVHPAELARQFAVEHPRGGAALPHWRPAALPRLAWLLLLAGLLLALGAGALMVGSRPESMVPAVLSPATPAPTANPDETLMDDLAVLWSSPYDAARVAALYAPDAVFYDKNANETSRGLEEIQAKVKDYAAKPFKVKNASTPIRQGDVVAAFQLFGSPEAKFPGLVVVELKDGKVLNQWVYPAP